MSYLNSGNDHKAVVPYSKYLDSVAPDFEFVGDPENIDAIVRSIFLPDTNSVLLTGPVGVGKSNILAGLVKAQNADSMPNEIMLRPFYRLNVNKLFNSTSHQKVEETFGEVMNELESVYQKRGQKPILIIDDGDNFVANIAKKGHGSILNRIAEADQIADHLDVIMSVSEKGKKQLQEDYSVFLKGFSTVQVEEPSDAQIKQRLEQRIVQKYEGKGVTAADQALDKIIDLTNRYPKMFPFAQPKRAERFLDEAATAFKLEMHSQPEGVADKKKQLALVDQKLEILTHGGEINFPEGEDELETTAQTLQHEISLANSEWQKKKDGIRKIQSNINEYESLVLDKETEIARFEQKDAEQQEHFAEQIRGELVKAAANNAPEAKGRSVPEFKVMDTADILKFVEYDTAMRANPKIREYKKEIRGYEKAIQQYADKMAEIAGELEYPVELGTDYVEDLAAKITKTSINPDMMNVMMNAEDVLGNIVLGQDQMIQPIAKKLRIAAAGGQDPNKPLGNFTILGPSGVGKTFIAETMAEQIFGSEDFLIRFSMETYQEEQNVSTLLGSARGLVGSDEPGELIRAIQEKPYAILLLDEIEKANKKIKQALLTALDKGVLVGMDGSVADLRNIIVVQTSNYGQDIFLRPGLSYDDAKAEVLHKIYRDPAVFSPEYLNRGEVVVAEFLTPEVMESITKRALKKQQKFFNAKHPDLKFTMDDESAAKIVEAHYKKENGARIVENIVKTEIGDAIATKVRDQADKTIPLSGTMNVSFDTNSGFSFDFVKNEDAPALDGQLIDRSTKTGAAQAFNIS